MAAMVAGDGMFSSCPVASLILVVMWTHWAVVSCSRVAALTCAPACSSRNATNLRAFVVLLDASSGWGAAIIVGSFLGGEVRGVVAPRRL